MTSVAPTRSTTPAWRCEAHEAYVLASYRLAVDEDAKPAKLRERAQALHQRLKTLVPANSPSASPVWEEVSRQHAHDGLHQDLMPVVDRILHGGDEQAPMDESEFYGLPPLRLNASELQTPYLLELNPAACARVGSAGISADCAAHLGVAFTGVTLYTFASGLVLVCVGLRFHELGTAAATLPAALLEEGLYALGHAQDRGRQLRAVRVESRVVLEPLPAGAQVQVDPARQFGVRLARAEDHAPSAAAQSGGGPRVLVRAAEPDPGARKQRLVFELAPGAVALPTLLDTLLGLPDEQAELRPADAGAHGRVFTFCAALLEAGVPDDEFDRLTYRLSRRFNTDYHLSAQELQARVIRPFENVRHAIATQGGSVVARDNGADFIRKFVSAAVAPAYLPMALLSYHEYLHLLHLTQECAFIPNQRQPGKDVEHIQSLRHQLARFRLYFRFSHLSDIAHHNLIHHSWREAMDIDHMLRELALDVHEADLVLERAHQAQRERRWRVVRMVASFAAVSVSASHLLDLWLKIKYPEHLPAKVLEMADDNARLWSLCISLGLGLVAALVVVVKGPQTKD